MTGPSRAPATLPPHNPIPEPSFFKEKRCIQSATDKSWIFLPKENSDSETDRPEVQSCLRTHQIIQSSFQGDSFHCHCNKILNTVMIDFYCFTKASLFIKILVSMRQGRARTILSRSDTYSAVLQSKSDSKDHNMLQIQRHGRSGHQSETQTLLGIPPSHELYFFRITLINKLGGWF